MDSPDEHLVGAAELAVRRMFQRSIASILVGIDVVGVLLAGLLLLFVVPLPQMAMEPRVLWGTTAMDYGYTVLATWSAVWVGSWLLEPVARWEAVGGTADEFTQRRALEAPLSFARCVGGLWAGALSSAPSMRGGMTCA